MLVDDVISVFRAVLTHPKIQAELMEVGKAQWGNGKEFKFLFCGMTYTLSTYEDKKFIRVTVSFINDGQEWPTQFFGDKFLKSAPKTIRKSALIFRKKLEMKPVYDVLQS